MSEKVVNEAVRAFMREQGSKGGKKRAKRLTKRQIAEIGRKGAEIRWGKKA